MAVKRNGPADPRPEAARRPDPLDLMSKVFANMASKEPDLDQRTYDLKVSTAVKLRAISRRGGPPTVRGRPGEE